MEYIQKLMLKTECLVDAETMYIRGNKYYYLGDKNSVFINKNGYIDTGTYFNAFSLFKWRKYTDLQSLILHINCKGVFTFTIVNHYLSADKYLERYLYEKTYDEKNEKEINIDLSDFLDNEGIISFKINAYSDCIISDAAYLTKQNISRKRLALAICTYKREKYISKLINNYNSYSGKKFLGLFIADNGKSLNIVGERDVHIFPNKNAGGAAGFARCMLEVSEFNKEHKNFYDYIVLMDDDISLDFNIFDRLVSFISLIKDEFCSHFIAGSMCSLDNPYIQYERYSSWQGDSFIQFGANKDLRKRKSIIENERVENFSNKLAGWWFCCFATQLLTDNNYPFPCFFRGDDMEYSVRNRINIITLNGVCVWHEPFYKKYSIVSEYYYLIRNTLVMDALYFSYLPRKELIKYLLKKVKFCLLKYDYDAARLVIRAGNDYLKGTEFFKNTDAEKLHDELLSKNHKLYPIQEVCENYRFEDIEEEIFRANDKNKLKMYLRRCSVNGLLIPCFLYRSFGFALIGFKAKNINFYKVKKVLNLDPFTYKGYFTEVNKKMLFTIISDFIKLSWKIKRNNEEIKKDYQIHLKETFTKEFWEKYLDMEV